FSTGRDDDEVGEVLIQGIAELGEPDTELQSRGLRRRVARECLLHCVILFVIHRAERDFSPQSAESTRGSGSESHFADIVIPPSLDVRMEALLGIPAEVRVACGDPSRRTEPEVGQSAITETRSEVVPNSYSHRIRPLESQLQRRKGATRECACQVLREFRSEGSLLAGCLGRN